MVKTAARRYSKALFELASEKNAVSEYKQIALAIIEKNDFKNIPDDFIGLFDLLIKKRRENDTVNILRIYCGMADEYENILSAEVISVNILSEEQQSSIVSALSKKFNKKINIKQITDPTVIAGIKIKIAGLLIDGTAEAKLASLKKYLLTEN